MITPETMLALTQMIRLGVDSMDALNAGEKTEEEVIQDIEDMHDRVKAASARWRGEPT